MQPLKSKLKVENISHRGVPFYLLFKDFSITIEKIYFLKSFIIVSEVKCPKECECIDHNECSWSVDLIQEIEAARVANNHILWNSYSSKFRQQICSFEEKKVCCCQSDRLSFSNEKKISSETYGKPC